VYNTLNKFVRRIIDKMNTLEFKASFGMLFIPLGFSLIVAGLALNLEELIRAILVLAGIAGVGGGAIFVNHIYNRMGNKEIEREQRQEERYNELLATIKGIREDLNKKG
jgi:hypothetical protein